jgi:membrane protein YdbS with pleckstrin-like domain
MDQMVIRPTTKFVKLGYIAVIVVIVGVAFAQVLFELQAWWMPVAAALLLLWPAIRHWQRRFTLMTITGDKLRYETGILSKSTRTIQLSKVQDVTVHQSVAQRMYGIGNLSIETAGETSRLTFPNIDSPQQIADQIIDISHRFGGKSQDEPQR